MPAIRKTSSPPVSSGIGVVQHHSFATGGHGKDEYFGQPDEHNDRIDGRTAESCNVYNMLKLTRRLFALRPDAHYAEFHERALLNHVLASIDPEDGRTCYMVPVGRGVRREYSDMLQSFTCCVGTGMESHALHGDGIYYESADRLWVNLYAPSTAKWESAGATITVADRFAGRRIGDAHSQAARAKTVHARLAPTRLGRRRVCGSRQWRTDRRSACRPVRTSKSTALGRAATR